MSTISEADLTKSLNGLASTFRTAITATIDSESQPLKRTQSQRDQVDIRRNIYLDMKKNLDALQSAVQALISTQGAFALNLTSKPNVVPGTVGANVLTATSTESAVLGDYDIAVTQLAKAHTISSGTAASPDIALGKSGTFWMGGTGTADLQTETAPGVYSAFVPSGSVTAATTSTVADNQRELGTGDYTVQVRESSGVRQFRLVNADGTAVSIRSTDGAKYTSDWQTMPTGSTTYNTGRGLSLELSSTGEVGSTSLYYTAKGTSITISATDTQRTIVNMINAATQPEGRDFRASVVAGTILLSGVQTGENHSLVYSDGASLGFALLQNAQNAQFKVNNMTVSRANNTGLTDVIDGVTLNLASDAEGKTARVSIAPNADKASAAMNTLVSAFNAAFTHLTQKMAVTSTTTGDKTTYSREPLAGDTVFRSLRFDMVNHLGRSVTNSGSFKNLSDIGLSINTDLKLTLDASKFSEALKNNGGDVKALLDAAMGSFNTTLARFTGSSGSLQASLTSYDDQLKTLDTRISKYNESLLARKQALIGQYQAMQSQLVELGYQAQMFGIDLTGKINYSG